MIEFSCNGCGKRFSVGEHFAGKQAKCKSCGVTLLVPHPKPAQRVVSLPEPSAEPASASGEATDAQAPRPASPTGQRTSMRMRRLTADAEHMTRVFATSSLIRVRPGPGSPPNAYRVEYMLNGLARGADGAPIIREHHLVDIQLTSEYPRQSPKCKIVTPIFHPNFDPTTICVGDHWTAGERLVDLVVRIGEMIAYQAYNIKSPLDGEAAMWADLHAKELPTDRRDIRPPD